VSEGGAEGATEGGQGRGKPSPLVLVLGNPRLLDAASIIVFSVGFILFNLHYWFVADYSTPL